MSFPLVSYFTHFISLSFLTFFFFLISVILMKTLPALFLAEEPHERAGVIASIHCKTGVLHSTHPKNTSPAQAKHCWLRIRFKPGLIGVQLIKSYFCLPATHLTQTHRYELILRISTVALTFVLIQWQYFQNSL